MLHCFLKLSFFICFVVVGVAEGMLVERALPVDLSFVVIDLKYNANQGVKVCEIQPGSVSKFTGYDDLMGEPGLLAKTFTEAVLGYHNKVWCIEKDITDPKIRDRIKLLGWEVFKDFDALVASSTFRDKSKIRPLDPTSITNYQGIAYVRSKWVLSREEFYKKYPGIVLMDGALFPYAGDKYVMNHLMSQVKEAAKIKPNWGLYEKKYSSNLVTRILKDISSEYLVIKPRRASKGNGVIIISRNDVKGVLQYILGSKRTLEKEKDESFNYWARDKDDSFLVEEFIISDPVIVSKLGNKLYDGTMRVVLLMAYNEGNIEMTWVEGHWKLPKKSIEEYGTLVDKHRSFAQDGYNHDLDPGTKEAVQRDLESGFIPLYLKMLETL